MARVRGADLDGMQALQTALSGRASSLSSVLGQASAAATQLQQLWHGPDSIQFIQRWNALHRPAMQRAVVGLETAADTVGRNRIAQESASSVLVGVALAGAGAAVVAVSPSEAAVAAHGDVTRILDAGDDIRMSNGELNDVRDRLAELTPAERDYVLANLDDQQLEALFHNVHSSGFWSNDWNDGERQEFYDIIADVSPETKARITNNPVLLASLHDGLSTDGYLDLLVALNTDHSGGTLPSAATSDELIRNYLPADYLDGPIDRGAQAEGNLAIVDETNFRIAYEAQTGKAPSDTLNGFVDSDGRQWVRQSRANAGTPVHEAIHNYADDALIKTAQPLNEGVTEYFTREVVNQTDDPTTSVDEASQTIADRSTIYSDNAAYVDELVAVVGEDVLAEAYFEGDMDGLKDAYLTETGRPESDWDAMIDLVDDYGDTTATDWSDATDLLTPVP